MLSIYVELPGRRFHATPWGRGVNEGAVEWPPSPWRLARALLAAWHRAGKALGVTDAELRSLLDTLAAEAPLFRLPHASLGHTRHYMPIGSKTAKVLDAFAHPAHSNDGEAGFVIEWEGVTLDEHLSSVLDRLLPEISYLGRRESWTELRRVERAPQGIERTLHWEVRPLAGQSLQAGEQRIDLLAPMASDSFAHWRDGAMDAARFAAAAQQADTKAAAKAGAKAVSALKKILPADVVEALECETAILQKAGWSQPPGATWVAYRAPRDLYRAAPIRRAGSQDSHADRPQLVRLRLRSGVPPSGVRAIEVADRLHRALVKHAPRLSVFSGRGADGEPMVGHEHVHILPIPARRDPRKPPGAIESILLYASAGFDRDALATIAAVAHLDRNNGHPWFLTIEAVGRASELTGQHVAEAVCGASRVWRSLTPFVPTRHPKFRSNGEPKVDDAGLVIGGPEHDLRRLALARGLPPLTSVVSCPSATLDGRDVAWRAFEVDRIRGRGRAGGRRSADRGLGFTLTFAEPVQGPLALGYGAHFGLGLFIPVAD